MHHPALLARLPSVILIVVQLVSHQRQNFCLIIGISLALRKFGFHLKKAEWVCQWNRLFSFCLRAHEWLGIVKLGQFELDKAF